MKILMTSTLALGALCVLALNQPAKAEISTNDPNFHLTHGGGHGGGGHSGHMGGGHMGGGHMGGGGHWAGHGGHGWHGHHGDWDGGWGWGGFGAGVAAGAIGATILDDGYDGYGYDYSQGYSNCWYDAYGNYVCE